MKTEEETLLVSAAFSSGRIVATDRSTVPHYYLCDHLGSTRAIVTETGVTETYDYYPYGLTWQQAEQPIGINTYLFTGKEWQAQDGIDLYDFGARFYQPRFGKWLSFDPLAEEYMGISPYAYCGNDPVNRVDPDGRKVVAIGVNAQKAILNTLPFAIRNQIEFDSQGSIDKSAINNISFDSGNLASLRQLVNDDRVYEINIADKITYKDENGALIEQEMGHITVSGYPGSYGFNTGEDGWQGVTQTPGNSAKKYNSPDDRVIITINQELSVPGQAQTFAHEGYGHAYLYSQGVEHIHRIVGTPQGFKENNKTLDTAIRKAIAETIINMNVK